MADLVIVESPSKAKTIGKYLGDAYLVKACMGHLRDLPKSTIGVDIENDFEPQYIPKRENASLIKELKSAAQKSETVYLATDPDREGEAISWHLQILLGIPEEKAARVTFNEITKKVVSESILEPRDIDMNLVDAQQARRVLDRIVGYQLSPLLWKNIKGGPRGLSAGRVQSAALKLILDRENEIKAFVPDEYWSIDLKLNRADGQVYAAKYYGSPVKQELGNVAEVEQVLNDVQGKEFHIENLKTAGKKRSAQPPFTTSSLQQEASKRLNMSPKRTMALAQQLYEGIEISGMGAVGLITYMRTDSLRISDEALLAAKDFITDTYGSEYYYGNFHRFKSAGNSQDAHEAIRPTNVSLTPERVSADLNKDQLRLYRLIWSRFIASQMANAVYDTLSFDNVCGKHVFRSSFQNMRFNGFTKIYEDEKEENEQMAALSNLVEGEVVTVSNVESAQHFTQAPPRYTEASLVKAMEENGVGRPSTYASIISTIQDRQYVENKEKHLVPTDVGTAVDIFLEREFNDVVDIEFTAHMEQRLDAVAAGEVSWKAVLREFYGEFKDNLEKAADSEPVRVPEEVLEEVCPECGRQLAIKIGRFGRFIACKGYPQCTYTRAIVEHVAGRCPKCGTGMLKKKSSRGFAYYSCETGNDCFMSWDVPTDLDCSECGHTLFKKSGRGNQTPFCINPACVKFLPEEKRGYYKKQAQAAGEGEKSAGKKRTVRSAKGSTRVKKTAEKKAQAANKGGKTGKKKT